MVVRDQKSCLKGAIRKRLTNLFLNLRVLGKIKWNVNISSHDVTRDCIVLNIKAFSSETREICRDSLSKIFLYIDLSLKHPHIFQFDSE